MKKVSDSHSRSSDELISDFVTGEYSQEHIKKISHLLKNDGKAVDCLIHHLSIRNRLASIQKVACPKYLLEKVMDNSLFADKEIPQTSNSASIPISLRAYRQWIVAAAVLVLAFFAGKFSNLQKAQSPPVILETFIVDHFVNGNLNTNSIHISGNHEAASDFLVQTVGWNPNIPPVANSTFNGLYAFPVNSNTITHVFSYTLDDGQPLYVFAMPVESMESKSELSVNDEAFSFCAQSEDYFIEDIKGKHVVSWRWKNDWYSAVSNHNGKDIAALLPN